MLLRLKQMRVKERKAMNKVKIRMMGSTSSSINNCIMSFQTLILVQANFSHTMKMNVFLVSLPNFERRRPY